MRDFRTTSKYTDVDLYSGTGVFVGSVHRSVLVAFSPVLDGVIRGASIYDGHGDEANGNGLTN